MSQKVFLYEETVEELACHILDLDYNEIDADTEIIEDKLIEKFDIDLNTFTNIVSHLLPLIDAGKSPLTEKMYKGFSNQKGLWLLKISVPEGRVS